MDKVLVFCFAAATLHKSYVNPSDFFDDSSRIAGGTPATDLQFPYVVSLQAVSQVGLATRGHSCGGALITLQHAVTSASCLYTRNAATGLYALKSPSAYRVFAGAALLTNDTSADRWRTVQAFIPHPNYPGPTSSVNDIGVITLSTGFPSNTGLRPLGLTTTEPAINTNCSVAGWGAPAPGAATMSNQLLYMHQFVYNMTLCAAVLNPQPTAPNVLPSMLCATAYNTQSTSCSNDTGNALVCSGTLAGVLSWHAPCQNGMGLPEVYTRASNYTAWLQATTINNTIVMPPSSPGLAAPRPTAGLAATLTLTALAAALGSL